MGKLKQILPCLKCLWAVLMIIGIVHLLFLALQAIEFHFSWCGTPHLKRMAVSVYYYTLSPFALVYLAIFWKNNKLLDRIVRICCISFLVVLCIYWCVENLRWGTWLG